MPSSSNNKHNNNKTVFVTVGTTLFDKLIQGVTAPAALQWMYQQGFRNLIIQYGKGQKPTTTTATLDHHDDDDDDAITMMLKNARCYDFASSLQEDMQQADLIISHAGAGTVMEALRMKKKLVVVINTDLMNNHQTELASAMHVRKLLWMVERPEDLQSAFLEFQDFGPLPHQEGDAYAFANLLDSFLGFAEDNNKKES